MKTSISAIFAYRLSGFHHPHTARYFGAEGNCRTPKKKHGKAKLYFSLIPREEAQAQRTAANDPTLVSRLGNSGDLSVSLS